MNLCSIIDLAQKDFIDHSETIHTLKRKGELTLCQISLTLIERPQYRLRTNKDKRLLNHDHKSWRFASGYLKRMIIRAVSSQCMLANRRSAAGISKFEGNISQAQIHLIETLEEMLLLT